MATATDRQKKAMGIFQFVLELILGLFKAHHGDALRPKADTTSAPEQA